MRDQFVIYCGQIRMIDAVGASVLEALDIPSAKT